MLNWEKFVEIAREATNYDETAEKIQNAYGKFGDLWSMRTPFEHVCKADHYGNPEVHSIVLRDYNMMGAICFRKNGTLMEWSLG